MYGNILSWMFKKCKSIPKLLTELCGGVRLKRLRQNVVSAAACSRACSIWSMSVNGVFRGSAEDTFALTSISHNTS